MNRKRITDYLIYLVVRVFICAIQAMRMETCVRLARLLAVLANDIFRIRRRVMDDNLRHVYPDWNSTQRNDLTRQMWEHLFLMACEMAHVPRKIHRTNWRRYIHLHRSREMVGYMLDPRPVVVVSGHFGNFEMAAYSAGLLGVPSYSIARPLDNPFLHDYINRFRGSKGQFILPKEGSAQLIGRLLDNGCKLALLGDQHAGAKGCWVDFLGRPASCHKALAVFTLTAGAPMVVAYAKRLGRPLHFEVGIQGIVDPREMDPDLAGVKPLTQWYNRMLEEMIRGEPSQYWWLHRRWKGQPAKRRQKKKATSPQTGDHGTQSNAHRAA